MIKGGTVGSEPRVCLVLSANEISLSKYGFFAYAIVRIPSVVHALPKVVGDKGIEGAYLWEERVMGAVMEGERFFAERLDAAGFMRAVGVRTGR